jgi:biotin carboxyl carrier protein
MSQFSSEMDLLDLDWADPALIREITTWLEQAEVNSIHVETSDGRLLSISCTPSAQGMMAKSKLVPVKSPFAGHFLAAHPAREQEILAKPGRSLAKGDVVGLIQTGSLLLALRAPCAGHLVAVAADHGALIGYGEVVMEIGERS